MSNMTISEVITLEGFEELIYVCDTSALVNLKISGNLVELRRFAEHHVGQIRIPQPIGKEISKREDDLHAWWRRNQNMLTTKFFQQKEHELHETIAVRYAKRPFPKEGKTYARVSDEDTYALVIAIVRHWTLVTDENAMQAVCRQDEYKAKYIDSSKFAELIKSSN